MNDKSFEIEKRNVLNEMHDTKMTLQELRFFSVFLANIKPERDDTRIQTYSVAEFAKICDIGIQRAGYIETICRSLMQKVVTLRDDQNQWEMYHLFDRCSCKRDRKSGQWFLKFEAHRDMLPFLFGYKQEYFRYSLWNALSLHSPNHIRMYEILKQYEKIGSRTITVQELRAYLGIRDDEYTRFGNFRVRILDGSMQEINSSTDIRCSYQLITGKGTRKIEAVKFTISKNESYCDRTKIGELLNGDEADVIDITEFEEKCPDSADQTAAGEPGLEFWRDACDNAVTDEEAAVLRDILAQLIDGDDGGFRRYHFLRQKYHEAAAYHPASIYLYLKKLLENEAEKRA